MKPDSGCGRLAHSRAIASMKWMSRAAVITALTPRWVWLEWAS